MIAVMLEGPDKQLGPDRIDEIAEQVSLSAVVIQDLQARRIKEYNFDFKRMTDARGDTGPYLQYTHARLSRLPSFSFLFFLFCFFLIAEIAFLNQH